MTDLDRLYELQLADSALDQMAYRRAHIEERLAFNAARSATGAARAALAANVARRDILEQQYAALEAASAQFDTKIARLEGQMRNVVVTREAEAIQREIALLTSKRDEGDEAGLLLLDESEALSTGAVELALVIAAAQAEEAGAAARLAVADAALDAEVSATVERRAGLVASLPADLVAEYESRRPAFKGVAVARLQGTRCTGCNLDVSRLEIESLRAVPEGQLPECPSCARIIVGA